MPGISKRALFLTAMMGMTLVVTALISACGSDDPDEYVFFSGGESGVYYPTAQTIAGLANKAEDGFSITVKTSGGSTENARALADGSADFALIQSDIAQYAREGTLGFEKPIPQILGLAALYPEYVQIVALADSGVASLSDLSGKAVAVGAAGSGTEENARQILEAAGLSMDALGRVEHLSAADAVTALGTGDIDAAFFTFGLGTPAINDLATKQALAFVPVDGDAKQKLLAKYSFYSEGVIAANSYAGVESDVPTVTVTATLVAREGVPDEVVEATLADLYDHLDVFDGGRLADLTAKSGEAGLSLPLHPGAKKYYDSH